MFIYERQRYGRYSAVEEKRRLGDLYPFTALKAAIPKPPSLTHSTYP